MKKYLEKTFLEFYDKIKFYKSLGTRETKFSNLIAKAPHIGTEAWLHALYKPITEKEIKEIKENLEIPEYYQEFLKICNGFSVFGTSLSLFGYRFNNKRDLENVWQPFDIIRTNREKPYDAEDNHFFFGFYNWDGSKLYMDTKTSKIYRCQRNSIKQLNEWENLEDMLLSEINRLITLFDENGVQIDKRRETTPPLG